MSSLLGALLLYYFFSDFQNWKGTTILPVVPLLKNAIVSMAINMVFDPGFDPESVFSLIVDK